MLFKLLHSPRIKIGVEVTHHESESISSGYRHVYGVLIIIVRWPRKEGWLICVSIDDGSSELSIKPYTYLLHTLSTVHTPLYNVITAWSAESQGKINSAVYRMYHINYPRPASNFFV